MNDAIPLQLVVNLSQTGGVSQASVRNTFEEMACNARGRVRSVMVNGREFLVAPLSMIVPGVLHGSKGRLFYPSREIARNVEDWNGMPMVIHHPTRNGVPISGRDPHAMANHEVGRVYNAAIHPRTGGLLGEGWFDVEATSRADHTKSIIPRLRKGEPIELSTGLYTTNVVGRGQYNGRDYDATATNYKPDHLAILPDKTGACSIPDGCGVLVSNAVQALATDDSANTSQSNPSPRKSNGGSSCMNVTARIVANAMAKSDLPDVSAEKACLLPHEIVRGQELTPAQQRMFGMMCGKKGKNSPKVNNAGFASDEQRQGFFGHFGKALEKEGEGKGSADKVIEGKKEEATKAEPAKSPTPAPTPKAKKGQVSHADAANLHEEAAKLHDTAAVHLGGSHTMLADRATSGARKATNKTTAEGSKEHTKNVELGRTSYEVTQSKQNMDNARGPQRAKSAQDSLQKAHTTAAAQHRELAAMHRSHSTNNAASSMTYPTPPTAASTSGQEGSKGAPDMQLCPQCGDSIPSSANYCPDCGAKLYDMKMTGGEDAEDELDGGIDEATEDATGKTRNEQQLCTNCAGDTKCGACAAKESKVENEMTCPECGSKMADGTEKCPDCGHDMKDAKGAAMKGAAQD